MRKTAVSPLGTRDTLSYRNYLLNMPRTTRLEIRCIIRICINPELLVATFVLFSVSMWIVIQFSSQCMDIHEREQLTFYRTRRKDVSFFFCFIFYNLKFFLLNTDWKFLIWINGKFKIKSNIKDNLCKACFAWTSFIETFQKPQCTTRSSHLVWPD